MNDNEYLFTSESVTEGHPDKVADQISDGVLDAVLRDDPYGRVACETLVNTGLVVVSGEISTTTYVDIQEIVRETIRKIGYTDADLGFSADSCAVLNAVDKQSADIAQGVDTAYEARQPPAKQGHRLRLLYMAQFEVRPPRFAIQVNSRNRVTRDYAYFLENRLRQRFGLDGVPLVIDFKTSR